MDNLQKKKVDLGHRIVIQQSPKYPAFARLPKTAQDQCPYRLKSTSYRHG